jgi:hypothetical protein
MGTTWILHTETKGTGANMVPLERAPDGESKAEPKYGLPKLREPEEAPEPRAPRRFKVVDVMTREALAEDVSARDTVDALKDVRSMVDVNVYVWQPERERWRMLTLPEQRTLWEAAAREEPAAGHSERDELVDDRGDRRGMLSHERVTAASKPQ